MPAGDGVPRPTVWVNFAASADGRLAYAGGRRARLSSPEDLRRVQRMRADADAILVGVGTVEKDDPSLRVHWELLGEPPGRDPVRIVVDSSGRTPAHAKVLDGTIPTIVATADGCRRSFPPGVKTIAAGRGRVDLRSLFERLPALGIRTLMVEGGSEILGTLFRERLFDRCTVYYAPLVIGGPTAPPVAGGAEAPGGAESVRLLLADLSRMGEGFVATYLPLPPEAVAIGSGSAGSGSARAANPL